MALVSQTLRGVKVYHLTAGKSTPEWLKAVQKEKIGSLRYNDEFRDRIEFIQDFNFPQSSQRMRLSEDEQFLVVAGVYPPSIKVFELSQLSMYFERRFDNEIIDFLFLDSDWKKLALLRGDRYIEIHSQSGIHEKIRVPKFGRSLLYNKYNCELYITSSSPEVFRLNLQQGQFFAPLETNISDVLCSCLNPDFELLAFGGSDGRVELWDAREHKRCASIDVVKVADLDASEKIDITALQFDRDGLTLAVGTSDGQIVFFDIRSQEPLKVLDHRYGLPIVRITFHHESSKIYTADSKVVKIWNREDFSNFSAITPEPKINDLCICPRTGISFLAVEDHRCQAYFIPAIGPAPAWCGLLEALTEELEEKKDKVIYTDYKFVTREQLRELGLDNLIGSGLIKAYMHGFFMHNRLYNQVKQLNSAETLENYVNSKTKRIIEKKRKNRIANTRSVFAFNRRLAAELQKKKVEGLSDRFSAVFDDPDFKVDEDDEDYKRVTQGGQRQIQATGTFELIEEDDDVQAFAASGMTALRTV